MYIEKSIQKILKNTPNHLPVLVEQLKRIDSEANRKKHLDKVINAADTVIDQIDTETLAKHYGVKSLGVTLAVEQVRYANEWIKREGLEDVCRVEHLDYRDIDAKGQPFDKVSAIGIIEHIGLENYPSYFKEVHELLAPGETGGALSVQGGHRQDV